MDNLATRKLSYGSQCSKRIFKNQLDILSLELTASKKCHQILPTTLSSGGKC